MTKNLGVFCVLLLLITVVPTVALADDVGDSDHILCTAIQATVCYMDEDCEIGTPWNWNIPQFIEIDFAEKVLRTTKARGENRQTPFKNLEREAGVIFLQGAGGQVTRRLQPDSEGRQLQGVERGRAFSFAIEEETGLVSIAVARNGVTVSVFGACTPLPSAK